jgi:hypothetical protein
MATTIALTILVLKVLMACVISSFIILASISVFIWLSLKWDDYKAWKERIKDV